MKRNFIVLLLILSFGCAAIRPNPTPWTKGDKVAAAALILGHAADAASTERMLDNPNNYEMNPILGKHPEDTEVLGYFLITSALALLIGHLYPKLRKPLWYGYGALGAGLAIHNEGLDR